jgi:cytochrome P450
MLRYEWVRRPVRLLERNRRRLGPIFAARFGPRQYAVFVSDLEAVRSVIARDGDEVRMGAANGVFRAGLGSSSILVLDGDEHLRHRRLMAPGFKRSHVGTFERLIESVTLNRLDALPRGAPVPLQPTFERIAFDAAMAIVFGIEDGPRSARIRELFPRMMDLSDHPASLLPLLQHELGGLSPWGRLMKVLRELDDLLRAEIRDRRTDPALEDREDLLSMLSRAEQADGTAMTETELRDEMLTLLMAGQETTSAAMAWTFERLARSPEVLGRLEREIAEPAESDGEYLSAVIREALRLRPPVPVMARKARVPIRLGPYEVPAGWVIMPCVYLLHREPSIYARPEEFVPERFLAAPPPRGAWIPFGGGIRHCLGTHLAELELKVVLRTIVSRVELSPDGDGEAIRRRRFAFSPARDATVVLTDRQRRLRRLPAAERARAAQPA